MEKLQGEPASSASGEKPAEQQIARLSFRTLLLFQFGDRASIEAVAKSRASFITGMVLVILTGIPRDYDQIYFSESLKWLIGPLVFSFFSGTFLFSILYLEFSHRWGDPKEALWRSQWYRFMSLFWMTAPVAWLYAIPVERFLDAYKAAQANLALLAIVSLWRVLLMSRIIMVMQEIRFMRALLWVLLPAALEVLGVGFFGGLFSGDFARHVLASMSGMINSPEDNLMMDALGRVFAGAFFVLIIVVVCMVAWQFSGRIRPFPKPAKARVPAGLLAGLALAWVLVAIPAQMEQYRFVTHAGLVGSGKFRESVDYLASHRLKDFPASRRIEPDPYEYQVWTELPKIMAVLQPTDPEWVRTLYLGHLAVMFRHYEIRCEPKGVLDIFAALDRLPEGKKWLQENGTNLSKINTIGRYGLDDKPETKRAIEQLGQAMEKHGITNELNR